MARSTKKRKRKQDAETLFLDTSIQIEKVKNHPTKYLGRQEFSGKRLITSNHVLAEYKMGLIKSCIDFYFVAEVENNPADALSTWSNKFNREPKNGLIVLSIVTRICGDIKTNSKKDFLRQLESAISYLVGTFQYQIAQIKGDFAKDPIVTFQINSADDYRDFQSLVKTKKISKVAFWERERDAAEKLANCSDLKTNYPKLHERISNINVDKSMADERWHNTTTGDLVHAVECPKKCCLAAKDSVFNILCPLLNKRNIQVI